MNNDMTTFDVRMRSGGASMLWTRVFAWGVLTNCLLATEVGSEDSRSTSSLPDGHFNLNNNTTSGGWSHQNHDENGKFLGNLCSLLFFKHAQNKDHISLVNIFLTGVVKLI